MRPTLVLFLLFIFFLPKCQESTALRKEKIEEVRNFVKDSKYSQEIAIFINFRIPSGKFRFFIYDLKNNRVLDKGIVAHGSVSVIKNSKQLKFSNKEGSYQSSLGKYEIGESYFGSFGKSYRLKGLDSSNSLAVKRAIVLHSYNCIKDVESAQPACLSLGCPMLSLKFFKKTAGYIDSSKKPVILFAFY